MNENVQKGDPRIIAELDNALWRNRNRDNPNLARGRMFFDFDLGKVRIASGTDTDRSAA